MQKINSNLFPFSFFLSDRIKVNSLEEGAKIFGGATRFNNGIYSNIAGDEYITLNETNNTISLFVPSTYNINKYIDNKYYVNYCYNKIKSLYSSNNVMYYDTKGSWYSEELKKVVIEDITIITLQLDTITESDISNFVQLANWIKKEMQQEGVSIAINDALAII